MASKAYLWDACILYRWLNAIPSEYLDHIEKHLEDASSGSADIYLSTITLAEIKPSNMGRSGLSPSQVIASISSSFVYIDTSPDIMSLAGHLRDQTYQHIEGPIERASSRPLGLGDSIQLATAVALREEFGVQDLTLHTFDEGKRKDGEEGKKCVPLIGLENWCRDCAIDEEVQRVLSVPRKKPDHPSCQLPPTNRSTSSKKPPAG